MARGLRIHSNAVFNPFNYQELIAPIQDYQQAYDQMQDVVLAAGEEANQYRQLIDADEYASGILKGYNDALSEMSGKLSSEGLKTINKNSLLNLRRRYNNEVKPINDAAKTLASLQDMYRQAYAKDQTMMRGAMPSIRDLVENPGATPQMVSGNDLYKQGAQASKSASLRNFKETPLGSRMIRGYMEQVQEVGYSPELVNAFIQDASRIPELATEIANIQQMYNTAGLQDPTQANRFIMQGILDGIQYQRKTDYKYDQLGAEYRAAARAAKTAKAEKTTNSYINRRTVTAQKPLTKEAKQIEKFREYFDESNGTFRLNDKGRRALEGKSNLGVMYGNTYQMDFPTEFTKFINGISGENGSGDKYKDAEAAFNSYFNQHKGQLANASQFKEYDFNLSSNENKVVGDFLKTNEGKLHIAKRNDDGKLVIDKDRKPSKVTGSSDFAVNGVFIHPNGDLYAKTTSGLILLPTINEDAQKNLKITRANMSGAEESITDYVTRVYSRYADKYDIPDYEDPMSQQSIENAVVILNSEGYTDAAAKLWSEYQNYINDLDSMGYYVADMVRTLGAKEAQF